MLDEPHPPEIDSDRRDHILSAAERAFIRQGFHATSMQAIAAEARMSAGNLYRYFPSKDAIVLGLVGRDQAAIACDFEAMAQASDIYPAVEALLRRYFVLAPVGRHRLIIEIWAEIGRSPATAASCGAVDANVRARLRSIVERACRNGPGGVEIDPDFVVRVMATMTAGLFKRRATEPDFDGEAEVALALGIFHAALTGVLKPYTATGMVS